MSGVLYLWWMIGVLYLLGRILGVAIAQGGCGSDTRGEPPPL